MKVENFEKAEKLLEVLKKLDTSIMRIEQSITNEYRSLQFKTDFCGYYDTLFANENTFDVLLQHYKVEKARIEKELEEL